MTPQLRYDEEWPPMPPEILEVYEGEDAARQLLHEINHGINLFTNAQSCGTGGSPLPPAAG